MGAGDQFSCSECSLQRRSPDFCDRVDAKIGRRLVRLAPAVFRQVETGNVAIDQAVGVVDLPMANQVDKHRVILADSRRAQPWGTSWLIPAKPTGFGEDSPRASAPTSDASRWSHETQVDPEFS